MISRAYAEAMAAYNSEMNRRIFGVALRLSDDQRQADKGLFWRSIHGTLNHIYWADRMWLSRFGQGNALDLPIAQSDKVFDDFDALWDARQNLDTDLAAWASRLVPEDFEGDLVWYSGAAGRDMSKPRAICIMQIFNHQTHHRGQVHAVLTGYGEKTGDTDLPFIL